MSRVDSNFHLANTCFGKPTNYSGCFSCFVQNLGELAFTFALGPGKINSNPIFIWLRISTDNSMFCYLFLQNHNKDLFHLYIWLWLEMPWSSNSVGWIHSDSNSYFIQYNMLTRKTVHLMSIIQVLRITLPKNSDHYNTWTT